MATRKTKESDVIPPSATPEVGIVLLNRLIAQAEYLLANQPFSSSDHSIWENTVREYLTRAFGSDSRHIGVVLDAGSHGFSKGMSEEHCARQRAESLKNQIKAVHSVRGFLELELELHTSCTNCGTKYPKGQHNFCLHCGVPLVPDDELPTESFSSSQVTARMQPPINDKGSILNTECVSILKVLSDGLDTGHECTTWKIAEALNMERGRCQYFLDEMEDMQFVGNNYGETPDVPFYYITRDGRKHLYENELD